MLGFSDDGVYFAHVREYQHYQKFYEDFNFSAVSFLPELLRRTQINWFTGCLVAEWMSQYRVPVSLVLTKHGYCFNFNMQPAANLFHLKT